MTALANQEPVNILLVDDRPENLVSLKALLERPDYNLVLAGSGPEALSLVLRQDFAVILLDVAMPRMDGFETASIIKEREQSKLIPIIFITAAVYDMEHIFRGYHVGAVDYLRKPVDAEAVRAKVAVFVELYRQRRQIETQEDGIRTRDDFLVVAAHELRTPMTPLRLQAESLLRELKDPERSLAKEELVRRVGNIDKAARRLDALMERLLDESQLSIGKLRLDLRKVDLVEVVRDAVARMKSEAERTGATVTVEAREPVSGFWDPVRLDQVTSNLLENAIKNGSTAIEVKVSQDQAVARLSVRDHGPGIPADALERIFKRFDRAPLRHFSEPGLGLWIVRRVVEAHGGSVRVRNEPSQGSEFVVELPSQPQAIEPHRASPIHLEVQP